jgi:hypothetical protein
MPLLNQGMLFAEFQKNICCFGSLSPLFDGKESLNRFDLRQDFPTTKRALIV